MSPYKGDGDIEGERKAAIMANYIKVHIKLSLMRISSIKFKINWQRQSGAIPR